MIYNILIFNLKNSSSKLTKIINTQKSRIIKGNGIQYFNGD